jgi:hypothetical protein
VASKQIAHDNNHEPKPHNEDEDREGVDQKISKCKAFLREEHWGPPAFQSSPNWKSILVREPTYTLVVSGGGSEHPQQKPRTAGRPGLSSQNAPTMPQDGGGRGGPAICRPCAAGATLRDGESSWWILASGRRGTRERGTSAVCLDELRYGPENPRSFL